MNFEELQNVWNSQQDHAALRVDETAIVQKTQQKVRRMTWRLSLLEIALATMLLLVGVVFLKDPVLEGHDYALIVAGVASFMGAAFIWINRILRKKREMTFEDTLRDNLKKSISRIDYQIKRTRMFLWGCAIPLGLGLVIGLILVDDAKRYLFYTVFMPLFLMCMTLSFWQNRREIRLKLIPEKAELQAILNNLDEAAEANMSGDQ